MKKLILHCFILFFSTTIMAQVTNDDCDKAFFIPTIEGFCSKTGDLQYSTQGATPSGFGSATCINNVGNDVWYAFVPKKTDINIVITGQTSQASTSGGTLKFPEAVLYSGDCGGTLTEWECQKDASNLGIINLYQGGLIIGQTYYLRVQSKAGAGNKDGTFKLCIENYNPPKKPEGDCPTASVLCDKSPFVVQAVNGFGKDGNEITTNDGSCFSNGVGGGQNIEMSSTWYKWTCDKPGTLDFTLTPLKGDDDIDFILFELPNGLDKCDTKKAIRCMASGDSKFPSPCMGPTGLKNGESDDSESAGCGVGKNSFIAPIDMVAGKSYALMVNNFTSTGTGFKMEFGGTGTFLGPTAKVTALVSSTNICLGDSVALKDESFYANGKIVKWTWTFGDVKLPNLVETAKPPVRKVKYEKPGTKYIALTIETDKGCIVTDVVPVLVDSCCQTTNKITVNPKALDLKCPDTPDGEITLNPTNKIKTTYVWNTNSTADKITGLGEGTYTVTVTNEATCLKVFSYDIKSPLPITTDTLLKKPTCNGGKDGIITLVPQGGKSPYEFDFGTGFSSNNTLKDLAIGKYPIFIKDANGCLKAVTVDLKELELTLDPQVKAAVPPSCTGFGDGNITLKITNGSSPFEYDFGNGFQNSSSINNLKSGVYNVTVKDNNNCKGIFKFSLDDPAKLVLETDTTLITCNGANDGKAFVEAKGGTGAYKYIWNDAQKQTNAAATGLSPGNYTVSVTDANGCLTTADVGLIQPPLLEVLPLQTKDLLCYNDRTGEIQFVGKGGRPPYQYSLDGVIFQKGDLFKNLAAGEYSLIVRDTAGCEFQSNVVLREPSPFLVDAGADQTIELGASAQLEAITSPPTKIVNKWSWTPDTTLSCKDCPKPVATPFGTLSYTIVAVDDTGCKATDRVTIIVNKNRRTYPPNIFSPNDDNGINDRFTIYSDRSAKEILLLQIFDRWGNLVFQGEKFPTNDNTFGWNGMFRNEKAAAGTYTWIANIAYIDGEIVEYRGDILLLR